MASFNHISGAELSLLKFRDQASDFLLKIQKRIQRVLVDAPSNFKVQQFVLLVCENHQILWAVIKTATIDVMNMFVRRQRATDNARHYRAMFRDPLAVNRVDAITLPDSSFLIRPSQIFRIEQLSWAVLNAQGVFHAERPQLVMVASSLLRYVLTSRHIAELRQWRSIRKPWATLSRHGVYFNMIEAG